MSLTLGQIEKLEQLREQSDANGGRNKATGNNFILYGLYRTAVMDAAPELIQLARAHLSEREALYERISEFLEQYWPVADDLGWMRTALKTILEDN